MTGRKAVLAAGLFALGLASVAGGGQVPGPGTQQAEGPLVKNIVVPGAAGWVDTGIDVKAGEELLIRASGEVSLQVGNPAASCGPVGLDMLTVDQPVPKENLGALIGKVSQFVASRVDEDTGGEVRDEIFALFVIADRPLPLQGTALPRRQREGDQGQHGRVRRGHFAGPGLIRARP
jgi:hypothetical protein